MARRPIGAALLSSDQLQSPSVYTVRDHSDFDHRASVTNSDCGTEMTRRRVAQFSYTSLLHVSTEEFQEFHVNLLPV